MTNDMPAQLGSKTPLASFLKKATLYEPIDPYANATLRKESRLVPCHKPLAPTAELSPRKFSLPFLSRPAPRHQSMRGA